MCVKMSPQDSACIVKLLFLTFFASFLIGVLDAQGTVFDCDFDRDECGWLLSSDFKPFKWEQRTSGNPLQGHGPFQDVSGSGKFMNLRVSQEKTPTNVTVKSPVMKSSASGTSCRLRFSYSLYKSRPVHCANKKGDGYCKTTYYGQFKDYACNPNGEVVMLGEMMTSCAKFCGFKCPQLEVMVGAGGVSEKMKLSSPIVFSETWNSLDVAIAQQYTGKKMTVAIEAVTGWDVDSYIAVDNISFTGCNFPTMNKSVTVKTTKLTTQATSSTNTSPTIQTTLISQTKVPKPSTGAAKTSTTSTTIQTTTISQTKVPKPSTGAAKTYTSMKQTPVTSTSTPAAKPSTTSTTRPPTTAQSTGAVNVVMSSLATKTNQPITYVKPTVTSPPVSSVPAQSASANPTTKQGTTSERTSTVPAKPKTVTAARSLEKTTSSAMALVITTIYAPVLAVISYVVMSI